MAETILSKRPKKKQKIDPEVGVGLSWKTIKNQRQLMLMSFPIVIYILIFNYVPIWGWLMAFQNYRPALKFSKQQWVGLKHFKFLFQDDTFLTVLRNTLAMSIINLVLSFATAIILALLLNEIKVRFWKRSIQTISYLPHFLSWIIAAGIVATSLSVDDGIINQLLMKLHLINEPVMWLSQGKYFWGIVGLSNVWKEVGSGIPSFTLQLSPRLIRRCMSLLGSTRCKPLPEDTVRHTTWDQVDIYHSINHEHRTYSGCRL